MIKKIAFIGGRDSNSLGGIENYVLNLSQSLQKMGYSIVIYCESSSHKSEIQNNIKTIHWKSTHCNLIDKPLLGLISTLHALFIEKDVDLFHYNAWPPSLWSWIPLLFRKKTLMQGHGLEWQRTKYRPYQQKIMKLMESITSKTNKNIIMVSQDQSNYFLEHYKKECATIPPGVPSPASFDQKTIDSVLDKYQLKPHKYIIFLGRLVKDKNPDILIKSFLGTTHNDIQLVIVGDGPNNKGFVTCLKELADKDPSIRFTGTVYGDEKLVLLKESLLYCLPSTLEGLPISLLEAMSYGCNCICSDIPGSREAMGNNGVFVPLDNLEQGLCAELQKVIDSSANEYQYNEENISRVNSSFSWDFIAKQYVGYITKL